MLLLNRALRALFAGALLLAATPAVWGQAGEADLFQIRPKDELYLTNGTFKRGLILESANPTRVRFQDDKDRIFELPRVDVRDIRKRTTPESELLRLSLEHRGKPVMMLKVAREALTRFTNLRRQTMEALEMECPGQDPDILRLTAELNLEFNEPAKAEEKIRTLLKLFARPEDRSLLGAALRAQKKYDEALRELAQAYQEAPTREEIALSYAEALSVAGDQAAAQKIYVGVLTHNRGSAQALTGVGLALLRRGETAEAEKHFAEARKQKTGDPTAALGWAVCQILAKQYAEAAGVINETLTANPADPKALATAGWVKLLSGDPKVLDEAIENFRAGLKSDDRPRVRLGLATALDRAAFFAAAKGAGEHATKLRAEAESRRKSIEAADPNDAYLQYWLGERKFRIGDNAGAEKAFRRAADSTTHYAPVWGALGATALRRKDWSAAKDAYDKALALEPKNAAWHAGKGVSLLGLKQAAEARVILAKALELAPNDPIALCAFGYLANFERNEESAVNFFQRALAADGESSYAAEALRRLSAQRGIVLHRLTFSDKRIPDGWRISGSPYASVSEGGELVWSGAPSGTDFGGKYAEFALRLPGQAFMRLAADLRVEPSAPLEFGLRLSGGIGGYEVAFGKDAGGRLVYRVQTMEGRHAEWKSCRERKWPDDGRARLMLETEDLAAGKIKLYFNGELMGILPIQAKLPSRISAGVFLYPTTREALEARADNIILTAHRQDEEEEPEIGANELIPAERLKKEPQAPPPPKPADEFPLLTP
jgi:tetratricopeptide (TPR) repeat protein